MTKREILTEFIIGSEQTQNMAYNAIFDIISEARKELMTDDNESIESAKQPA